MLFDKRSARPKRVSHHEDTTHRRKVSVLNIVLVTVATIVLLVVALVAWIAVTVFSGPGAMELSAYHPFRSPQAKERYLARYDERARLWPIASETKMVETSYGQTFVRMSGPSDAPPLVLLPGGGATSLSWMLNIEALSAAHRTYAVDNIYDFGRSVYTRPLQGSDDFVAWLDELFSALDLGDHLTLVGLSYGGWLTSQYALQHPDRLDRIVLIAPAATVLPLNPEFARRGMLTLVPHRYFLKRMTYWLLEDVVTKDSTSRMLVDTAVDDIFVAMRCFKFKVPVNPTVLSDDDLRRLTVPTLFIVGENEKLYAAQEAVARLRAVAPKIETEIIPNSGHGVLIGQPELVNQTMLRFLNQP